MINEFEKSIDKMVSGELNDPVVCPCCKMLHKVYKRGITSAMSSNLIQFYNHFGSAYGHLTEIKINGGGDFAKLRFWGLIEHAPEDYADTIGGKSNGYWRVTKEGLRFVYGHCSVIQYKHILNGVVVGESGDYMTISDNLGAKFDYNELMAR